MEFLKLVVASMFVFSTAIALVYFYFRSKVKQQAVESDTSIREEELRYRLIVGLKEIGVDEVFANFIGNEGAVSILKREIKYAFKNRETRLPALGLFGPKSTGKTELARRIAKALGLPMLVLSKSTLAKEENFFTEVSKEIENYSRDMLTAPPMIVFLDEAHVLSGRIQDSLLTAMERDDRVFRSSAGDINTHNITFVVATTDPGKLREAFRSRLLILNLEPYTIKQVVDILLVKIWNDDSIPESAKQIPEESLAFIAKAARGVPRKAIELLSMVAKGVTLGELGTDLESVQEDFRVTLGCDAYGLLSIDRRYLEFLSERDRAGIGLLVSALGYDRDNLENVVEPWLLRNGWIERERTGRKITPTGSKIIGR